MGYSNLSQNYQIPNDSTRYRYDFNKILPKSINFVRVRNGFSCRAKIISLHSNQTSHNKYTCTILFNSFIFYSHRLKIKVLFFILVWFHYSLTTLQFFSFYLSFYFINVVLKPILKVCTPSVAKMYEYLLWHKFVYIISKVRER